MIVSYLERKDRWGRYFKTFETFSRQELKQVFDVIRETIIEQNIAESNCFVNVQEQSGSA